MQNQVIAMKSFKLTFLFSICILLCAGFVSTLAASSNVAGHNCFLNFQVAQQGQNSVGTMFLFRPAKSGLKNMHSIEAIETEEDEIVGTNHSSKTYFEISAFFTAAQNILQATQIAEPSSINEPVCWQIVSVHAPNRSIEYQVFRI